VARFRERYIPLRKYTVLRGIRILRIIPLYRRLQIHRYIYLNQARTLAYADDTFLKGAPEPTIRAYQALTALAAPLGLHAQLNKCKVYSEDAAAASAVADHLELQHAPEGLLAAGTPIGTPAFESARADACAHHTCQLMEELQALPLAAQDRWLLLHGSLQRRVAHLPRGCPWQHVGYAVQQAESKAVDGVCPPGPALCGRPFD
jgi:hypothetical protein